MRKYNYHRCKDTTDIGTIQRCWMATLLIPTSEKLVNNICNEVLEAYDAMCGGDHDFGLRTAHAAKIGAATKRLRFIMIDDLTQYVMQGIDVSREYVRHWQQQTFGQSVSSQELQKYAIASRAGGGRAAKKTEEDLQQIADLTERALFAYTRYYDAVTAIVNEYRSSGRIPDWHEYFPDKAARETTMNAIENKKAKHL